MGLKRFVAVLKIHRDHLKGGGAGDNSALLLGGHQVSDASRGPLNGCLIHLNPSFPSHRANVKHNGSVGISKC
jgi:hypothetical protein